MVEAVTVIISAVLAGLAGGFLSSWMTFNASGEKFDGRKHGNALITGALTGMALGLTEVIAADVANKGEIEPALFAVGVFSIFLAAAGVDAFRSKGSKMVHKNSETTTTETTPTPAPVSTTTTTTANDSPK